MSSFSFISYVIVSIRKGIMSILSIIKSLTLSKEGAWKIFVKHKNEGMTDSKNPMVDLSMSPSTCMCETSSLDSREDNSIYSLLTFMLFSSLHHFRLFMDPDSL